MKEQKRFRLADLTVDSFVTSPEKIQGGTATTGSLPTGRICDKFLTSQIDTDCC